MRLAFVRLQFLKYIFLYLYKIVTKMQDIFYFVLENSLAVQALGPLPLLLECPARLLILRVKP